jgi:hypothetical protein
VYEDDTTAYVGEFGEDNTRWVPVDVVAPPEPSLFAHIGPELAEGDPLDLVGSTSPGTDAVSVRFCDAVPADADADDPAAVDAACEPATTVTTEADDGFRLEARKARLDDVAVWVGAQVGGEALAQVVPFRVLRPSLALSPEDELTVNQAVRVAPGLLVANVAHDIHYCEGAVLADGGATLDETTNQCASPVASLWSDEAGRIPAFELRVPSQVRVGPSRRPVSCTAAPGACALVIVNQQSLFRQPPWVLSGGVPLLIGSAPPLPVIVPAAGSVAEPHGAAVTATMPVTLSSPMAEPVTVQYQSFGARNSPLWAATPSQDYVPVQGTLTFAPGQTTATIAVDVLDDAIVEQPEMALVGLTQPTGGVGIGGFGGIGGVGIADTD